MAYHIKSSINFGLVYIPIKLIPTIKSHSIGFNMIEKNTMSRVKYKKTCVDCEGKEIRNEDIVRGYQYEKDKYVILYDEDFEKIKTKREKSIMIEEFVDIQEIDPLYYEKSYYVVPTSGEKSFDLLLKAMEAKNKVGIAKTVIGTKENLIALRVKDGKMLLSTLFFNDELQVSPYEIKDKEIDSKQIELAQMLIDTMAAKFDPKKYKDEYKEKLKEAIELKIAGQEIVGVKEKAEPKVINLMEALEKSIKDIRKKA